MIAYQSLTEKQQNRYDRILQMAEALIYENGFYNLSLTDLTQKLKVSRSTIYENFGSKEGLVEKVVENLTLKLNTGLDAVIQNTKLNTKQKFIQVARNQSESLDANCFKLLEELKIHSPKLYKEFEEGRKEREKNGYSLLIEQGINEGIFDKSLPKDFLLQLYLKMGQLLSDTNLMNHISFNKAEAMDTIIKVFLNGTNKIR